MAEAVAAGAGVAAAVIHGKAILWDPLKQTIASSNDMDEIYGVLDGVMKTLIARRNDHEDMAHKHKTTMMPSNTYTDWNTRVNVVAKEVDELKVRYMTKERKRSPWLFIKARSNFTKKMKKTASRVFALMEEDTHLVDVLVDKKPACVMEMITSQITNIPTLQQPLEETLGLLCNKEVNGIRIYGLVGSGKRIIMQNLNNHIKVAKMFDIVIWVSVSRKGSMKHRDIDQIQQDIVERLKLDIEVTSNVDLIANRIRAELTNIKYLLLLDDVNEDLDLDIIGVPKSENGSKIVITTRLQYVCSSIATTQINVEKLKPKEALEMFKSELNRPLLEENPNIKKLMRKIVSWCGHLPLMIKVAAGVFRVKETEQSWQDGLRNLSKWPYKGDNTMQEIYRLMKCCFDCLEDTQKTCFFYSALYPEDSDIQKDCLLYSWAAEELFDTTDEMEETLVTGREILENLMKVSLLMENASQQCIGMHKLIRLAALFTLSTNNEQENLVQSGEALQKPIEVECWKNKRWISLVDSKMNVLPDQPNCQTLSTLFLQKNPNLVDIPQEFFKYMQGLRVLNLYDTGITSLPQSFLNLAALKVLCLQECVALVELPLDTINFQNLEVLDVRGSGLVHIPPQVKNLNCLRRLLISFTRLSSSSHIQETANDIEVISNIPMLRELVIDVKEGHEIVLYDLIVQVFKLTSLSLLQFCFPKKVVNLIQAMGGNWKINFLEEKLLKKYISKADSLELKKCQFFFGCDISSHPHIMKFMPYFKFEGKVSNDTISQVLGNDVAIELVNHNELEHLSNFTPANMSKIHTCVIKDCNKMKTLVDSNRGGTLIFNNLEQLHLINLPVLKNIFVGPLLVDMPNLKKLMLVDMPQLTSILVNNSFKWHSLEKLKILRCPQLKRLPFQKDGAMKLKSIEAEESWWETLENDAEVKEKFRHYCIWR